MRVITAVESLNTDDISCFLAGGITNCPEWQKQIIEILKPIKFGILFNPRRDNFPIHDPNAAQEQITWEFNALAIADIFSMWFCAGESDQPICMYELGRHLAIRQVSGGLDRVCIGVEPGYRREQDVRVQTALIDSNIKIVNSIEEHAKNIVDLMEKNAMKGIF